jgi:imidazole glycerol-phosphate synthase subunit HisF
MLKVRVIPCLLLQNGALVKTVKFKKPVYVGDPINAIRIFNDKEVDELLFIDIDASKNKRGPDYNLIAKISSEVFMPFGYGGGIRSIDEVKKLTRLGVEKVCINSFALENPDFISEVADIIGTQSTVVAVDVKKDFMGHDRVYHHVKGKSTSFDVVDYVQMIEQKGAGEILLNSVDRDGAGAGYDLNLLQKVTSVLTIPVVALGGAGSIAHFVNAVKEAKVSAVAAGSFFVFYGPYKAVLITYPDKKELEKAFM